jgi:hypothetical protein
MKTPTAFFARGAPVPDFTLHHLRVIFVAGLILSNVVAIYIADDLHETNRRLRATTEAALAVAGRCVDSLRSANAALRESLAEPTPLDGDDAACSCWVPEAAAAGE